MRQLILVLALCAASGGSVQAASVCAKKVCVDVDVMRTYEEMKRGLQGRDGLADHQGMLFVFDRESICRFWMKDMKFSIDIIWLNSKRSIVTIAAAVPACTADPCEVYSPDKEARYVLEVPSGFTSKYHLKVGDVLKFKGIH